MAEAGSVLYRYLLGAMQQIQITMAVRHHGIQEEVDRLSHIVEAWRRASSRMQELLETDPGVAERIFVEDPPPDVRPMLLAIEADPLFQASFSDIPTSFKVVEIDKLVAPQREVNLDYVAALRARLPGGTPRDLAEFCLASRGETPQVKMLQTAQNQLTFTSRSLAWIFAHPRFRPLRPPVRVGSERLSLARMVN